MTFKSCFHVLVVQVKSFAFKGELITSYDLFTTERHVHHSRPDPGRCRLPTMPQVTQMLGSVSDALYSKCQRLVFFLCSLFLFVKSSLDIDSLKLAPGEKKKKRLSLLYPSN